MKTLIAILTATAVLSVGTQRASAGDHEWATAGKILTGVAIGGVVAQSLQPPPVYQAPPVVYSQPQVVYSQPQVVYSQPAPAPVYVAPPPVVVYAPPVYYARPAPYYWGGPVVSFTFGGRGGYHHHDSHYRGRW